MKDGQNGGRGVASLELGGEGMDKNIFFGTPLVGF